MEEKAEGLRAGRARPPAVVIARAGAFTVVATPASPPPRDAHLAREATQASQLQGSARAMPPAAGERRSVITAPSAASPACSRGPCIPTSSGTDPPAQNH